MQPYMSQGASTPIGSGVGLCHMLSGVIVTFMDPFELPMHHQNMPQSCMRVSAGMMWLDSSHYLQCMQDRRIGTSNFSVASLLKPPRLLPTPPPPFFSTPGRSGISSPSDFPTPASPPLLPSPYPQHQLPPRLIPSHAQPQSHRHQDNAESVSCAMYRC